MTTGRAYSALIIALFASSVPVAVLSEEAITLVARPVPAADPFQFDTAAHDPIRFSRSERTAGTRARVAERQTEFAFLLKPAMPSFTRAGNFGLSAFGQPEIAVYSGYPGALRPIDAVPELHQGFAYSAGLRIEHDLGEIDGTAYVSSSLMGLSYGRLGRLWYGGVDVNIEQFSDAQFGPDQSDVLSLDLTTGRRLGLTGTSAASPLWLLTLQGSFDVQELERDDAALKTDWYLNPSLFWQRPGFTFSAQVQVPMDLDALQASDPDEPDYRLRAVFEKQF